MQELFVKICGITSLKDAEHAVHCGADAIGMIFYENSDRYVTRVRASEIVKRLPEHVSKIGVFVNADRKYVHEIVSSVHLSAVQLYGNDGPDDLINYETSVIKVFRVNDDFDVEVMKNYVVDAFLLDTYRKDRMGGTGKTFDWNIALKAKEYGKIILSGGLTPENVTEAVRFVQPYGVDVSSGVEISPGKKDPGKVKEFIVRAKSVPLFYDHDQDEE